MDTWIQDFRYAARLLMRDRSFTAVAVFILALGIGANTAIFSLVHAVLLRPLSYRNPDRLVWVWSSRTDTDRVNFSVPDFLDYRDRNRTLQHLSAFSAWSANLVGAGEPERIFGVRCSADLFQMLGVEAEIGRTLTAEDDDPGNPRVVVLGHGFWKRRFGGSADILGNQLTLSDESYSIAGVLPADFTFPKMEADIFVPLAPDADPLRNERASVSFLSVIGRLKDGVTLRQAESDLGGIAGLLRDLYPVANASKKGVELVPLHEELVGNYRTALVVLSCAVGLVLLIGCANLANLVLARASTRYREMAIRLAVGASRGRLIRQLLTESLLLAWIGGILGLSLTHPAMKAIVALSPASLPRTGEMEIDTGVLLFATLISVLSGAVFGLAPALSISKVSFVEELKGSGKGSSDGSRRSSVRNLLVLAETALALLLLIGAGLLVRSFVRLQAVSPGFDFRNLLVMRLSLPETAYSKPEEVAAFYEQLSVRIQNVPGVQSVAATSLLPLSGSNVRINFTIAGRPPLSASELPVTQYRMIGPNYFRTMKIPFRAGRDFANTDTRRSQPVAIINEVFARSYWREGGPIGALIYIDDNNQGPREVAIIGVVGDVRHTGLHADPAPELYLPIVQIPEENVSLLTGNMTWVVRTSAEPLSLSRAVRREIQSVAPTVPAGYIRNMEQFLSTALAPNRFHMFLVGIFAAAALILAGTGIYAVISYSVTRRTHELGIRMALGARQLDVVKLVVGGGMKVVLAGVGIGIGGALALTRALSHLVYGVSVTDPPTFVLMSVLLIVVSMVATYIPARRAAGMDTITALRSEELFKAGT